MASRKTLMAFGLGFVTGAVAYAVSRAGALGVWLPILANLLLAGGPLQSDRQNP